MAAWLVGGPRGSDSWSLTATACPLYQTVQGDFFSLHMPLTPNTKGMFNDEAFGKVRRGRCC